MDTRNRLANLTWLNPPAVMPEGGEPLRFITLPDTDFWQLTHYGFRRDNGHFLHRRVDGDFDAEVEVHLAPTARYDQAGLMIRIDHNNWIKTSVEFEPGGGSHLGAVVTQLGLSDWSMRPLFSYPMHQAFRIERRAGDYTVLARVGGGEWEQIRLARLHADFGQEVMIGPYACSPTGAGCDVSIHQWQLTPA